MTFEESKQVELTNQEETLIKQFAKLYSEKINKAGENVMPSSFVVETLVEDVVDEFGNRLWFFGRALNEVGSGIKKRIGGFEKMIADRSVVRCKEGELEEWLNELGRYYFAKTFDHGYESLRSVSKSWVDLDEYVKQRKKQIKLDSMVKKLPELHGIC
jgi:hypothetical protein